MNRTLLAVLGIIAVGVAAVAVASSTGLLPPLQDDEEKIQHFPTETPTPTTTTPGEVTATEFTGGTGDGGTTRDSTTTMTTTTTTGPPFLFTIESVEECGTTCRDVTVTLENRQPTTATDVTVYTRIFAGQGTDGEIVWSGTEEIGTLEPGESVTSTRRVKLTMGEAFAVRQQNGWITIQTTVQSTDETMTFTNQRDVI
ncbi:MAG: hypothetical protein ABEJ58_03825 [Halodesulfurarchaeum sp.]